MVIKNNVDAVRTYNVYHQNTIALSDSMYKVSSGERVYSAKVAPSDYGISEKMRGDISANEQAERNVQNGANMLKTATDSISNIVDILNSMKERLVNGANDSNSETDRNRLNTELADLAAQITQNASVKYNGKELLAGDATDLNFQIGIENGDVVTVTAPETLLDAASLGVDGLQVDDNSTAAGNIEAVDTAIETALTQLATYASIETRLGFAADNVSTTTTNLISSESTIRDMDLAKGMNNFMKFNVLTQASQFMNAQAAQNPYSVLQLLQAS